MWVGERERERQAEKQRQKGERNRGREISPKARNVVRKQCESPVNHLLSSLSKE